MEMLWATSQCSTLPNRSSGLSSPPGLPRHGAESRSRRAAPPPGCPCPRPAPRRPPRRQNRGAPRCAPRAPLRPLSPPSARPAEFPARRPPSRVWPPCGSGTAWPSAAWRGRGGRETRGWLQQRIAEEGWGAPSISALRSLSDWDFLPCLSAPAQHGEVCGLRAGVRATAVEAPAGLLVERLPAALSLAYPRRPLRRLHLAGHQEGPLSGFSWAP